MSKYRRITILWSLVVHIFAFNRSRSMTIAFQINSAAVPSGTKVASSRRGWKRETARDFSCRRVMRHLSSASNDSKAGEKSNVLSSDDASGKFSNENNIRDQVFSAISKDGSVKITACTVRNIINDLMIQNTMTEVPADALGRTLISALLVSNGMQKEQSVQITMNSDGPLRGIVGIAKANGDVRGFVGSPMLGKISLQEAVGKGSVQVVKNHPDWPRPYNGITAIRHSDIDRDIGIYLAESEQRSCALAAATSINGVLCTAAGGYLIEQLPFADEETIARVEQNIAKLVEMDEDGKLPTGLLTKGITPFEIAEIVLEGLDMQPLDQLEPKLVCDCTNERLLRALRLLPREEVEDILEKEEKIEARCHFCGKVFTMGPDEIRKKLDTATGDPSKDSEMEA